MSSISGMYVMTATHPIEDELLLLWSLLGQLLDALLHLEHLWYEVTPRT